LYRRCLNTVKAEINERGFCCKGIAAVLKGVISSPLSTQKV
jgi:hypothetical protein